MARSLVWLEKYLFTERGNLVTEWFASDALVHCRPVAANKERRQCPWCMSYKRLQY